jgi:hypothetical protein
LKNTALGEKVGQRWPGIRQFVRSLFPFQRSSFSAYQDLPLPFLLSAFQISAVQRPSDRLTSPATSDGLENLLRALHFR